MTDETIPTTDAPATPPRSRTEKRVRAAFTAVLFFTGVAFGRRLPKPDTDMYLHYGPPQMHAEELRQAARWALSEHNAVAALRMLDEADVLDLGEQAGPDEVAFRAEVLAKLPGGVGVRDGGAE